MIRTAEELAAVQAQLGRAETALQAIRDEVLPKSKERFLLMAESYVDMIQHLRAEIDEYLGVDLVTASRQTADPVND
jgi:hypothetical protein